MGESDKGKVQIVKFEGARSTTDTTDVLYVNDERFDFGAEVPVDDEETLKQLKALDSRFNISISQVSEAKAKALRSNAKARLSVQDTGGPGGSGRANPGSDLAATAKSA
jgi:hypothetical protein